MAHDDKPLRSPARQQSMEPLLATREAQGPPPTKEQVRERIEKQMLEELRNGKLEWYYISVADNTFRGGYVVQAAGPTLAWHYIHVLGWYVSGCSTQTTGPIPAKTVENIPEDQRWRKLTREEALNLGKPKGTTDGVSTPEPTDHATAAGGPGEGGGAAGT